ncbi:C40 family peptidase [Streptomyces silvisoli]|uniref:C40 family peptidase n=1 Tax=Streptomyces silvisoli TaxID=3034235 RepID=A0ABT5ZS50_9ACTN|nr:C40 family peptidase [Streptomyces silvisoli]MDF3291878.1 C40 family peptidase [Streptomyces silvisoli]
MKKVGAAVGLAAAGPLVLAVPLVVALAGKAAASCAGGGPQTVDSAAVAAQVKSILSGGGKSDVSVAGLDDLAEQIPNAKIIEATGTAMHVPARGQVVALATALQESGLKNLTYGDRDSLGLFQQRPSQGWGTPAQIEDPVYASTQFYSHLLNVPGWQSMTVTQAAQKVQGSAFPDAYAKWEPLATALQKAIATELNTPDDGSSGGSGASTDAPSPSGGGQTGGLVGCSTEADGSGFGPIPAGALPAGYQIPATSPVQVRTAIRWALGQLGTPYQWGGHCTDPHGGDPMGRCDCSSLMQMSYKAGGISLGRTTYDQVTEGKGVDVDHLQPGDLLFTESSAAAPGHVGMYIGSGLIINAPHTGDVVRIATLASWKPQILATRRVV